ncbi:thioredoxin domain-containing protein [Patescibacteria group bacterium]|nr:thioredoxin domain-containing protein [Patescibacteria group bacterium]
MSKQTITMVVIGAVIIIGAFILFKKSPTTNAPAVNVQNLVTSTDHMTGSSTAKVQLVEFGDYQCPACGYAYPAIKQVVDAHASDPNFNFVFRNFPLPMHANALAAAQAAEAAGEQGKYFEMHDLLYTHQNDWAELTDPTTVFEGYAQQIHLDTQKFKTAMTDPKITNMLLSQRQQAMDMGIAGTPTFFLNNQQLPGIPTADELEKLITNAENGS